MMLINHQTGSTSRGAPPHLRGPRSFPSQIRRGSRAGAKCTNNSAASSGIQAKQWRLRIGPLFRCEGTGKCLPGNHQGGRVNPHRSLCLNMIKPLRTSYPGRKRRESGVTHSCLLLLHCTTSLFLSLSLFFRLVS